MKHCNEGLQYAYERAFFQAKRAAVKSGGKPVTPRLQSSHRSLNNLGRSYSEMAGSLQTFTSSIQ